MDQRRSAMLCPLRQLSPWPPRAARLGCWLYSTGRQGCLGAWLKSSRIEMCDIDAKPDGKLGCWQRPHWLTIARGRRYGFTWLYLRSTRANTRMVVHSKTEGRQGRQQSHWLSRCQGSSHVWSLEPRQLRQIRVYGWEGD